MILKKCSAHKLEKVTRHKKLICYGTGSYLTYMLRKYSEYKLENRIDYLIDGNITKQGTRVDFDGVSFQVNTPESLANIDFEKYVLLIASSMYEEIFIIIQNLCKNRKGVVYALTEYKYASLRFIEKFFCCFPLKNYIVLQIDGLTYDNSLAFGKYIAEHEQFGKKYKVIWACKYIDKHKENATEKYVYVPSYTIPVTKGSGTYLQLLRYIFYVSRAKFIFFDDVSLYKLRSDQILIYMNHGSPSVKKVNIQVDNGVNYVLLPSEYSIKNFCSFKPLDRKRILLCGAPRTDVFFRNESMEHIVKHLTGNKFYKKIILWMPTFRESKRISMYDGVKHFSLGLPIIESESILKEIDQKLVDEETLLIIKVHNVQNLDVIKISDTGNIKVITQKDVQDHYASIYNIMKFSDALITDYSSVAFDYMLLDRPIGYTIDDLNEYKRGFAVENPLELMPGFKINTIEDFLDFINSVSKGKDSFRLERTEINKKAHAYLDGGNCKRLCELLQL